ncbi:MAG: hypothetical protein V4654_01890 [Bdellovibrionota bacterium]
MTEKTTLAELISLGSYEAKKWDWGWYVKFLNWFLTSNEKTTINQKLDYLNHLLENNTEFRKIFVEQWTQFIEVAQFDSFWIHTFSGESDSFFQEFIWAFTQKLITSPSGKCEVAYLMDCFLQFDLSVEQCKQANTQKIQALAQFFPPGKIVKLKNEIRTSLVRAVYILACKNLSTVYSSDFEIDSIDKHNSDFMKMLSYVNLTDITDETVLNSLNDSNLAKIELTIENFRESGVSLNSLFKIKKVKSRLLRIKNLFKLYQSFNKSALLAILVERQNFYSLKFQFFHYSSQLIEVVSMASAETGDHYVARTRQTMGQLWVSACGGGFITGFTVLLKTLSSYLYVAPFLSGFISSLNYGFCFVLIYLCGFTLATKQPAAIAAHLAYQWKKLNKSEILKEIDAVFKSQFLAVLGNVGIVIPTVLGLSYLSDSMLNQSFMTPEKATAQIDSMAVFSFTPFYAVLTGYFLWFSTFISGVADNFFKVYQFDKLILNSPKILSFLSPARKRKWVEFFKNNFGALMGNLVLGFILGLVPVFGTFLGLPLDVRHVTLSAGTLAAAVYTLGFDLFSHPAIYLAIVGVIITGILNLSVSFMISLRVAESSDESGSLEGADSRSLLHTYLRKKLGFKN